MANRVEITVTAEDNATATVTRITDRISAQLEEIQNQLRDLAGETLIDLRIETSGASLAELRADLDRVGGLTTARVDVQVAGQLDDLDVLRIRLDEVAGRTDARVVVDVEPADAAARLEHLWLAVEDLAGRTDVRLVVEIEPPDVHLQLARIREELDRIGGTTTVHIRTDVDGQSGSAALTTATRNTGLFGTALGSLGTRAKTAVTGLLGLGTTVVKLGAEAAGAVDVGVHLAQWIGQMAPAAALAGPAVLTLGESMGVLKLASAGVSQQFQQLTPALNQLKTVAASSMHGGIQDLIDGLKTDLPIATSGVKAMGGALGDLASQAGMLVSQPFFQGALKTIVEGNAKAVRGFGDAGLSAADALVQIAAAAEPAFVNLSELVRVGASQISQWVDAKAASGDLARSIQAGADSVGAFLTALWNFGVGLHSIFDALKGDSSNLSESLLKVSTAFEGWATSESTINTIKIDLADMKQAASEAWTALQAGFSGQTGDGGAAGIFEHIGSEARLLVDFVQQQLFPTLTSLGALLTGPLGTALMSAGDIIHTTVLAALTTLMQIVRDDLVPILAALAPLLNDEIIPAISSLATWAQQNLLPAVSAVAATIRDQLVPGFRDIQTTIEQNKPELEALGKALGDLGSIIVPLLAFAIENNLIASLKAAVIAIDAVITIISQLVVAFADIVEVGLRVAAEITAVFKAIFDAAATAVSGIIGVFATLPDPLGAPFRAAKGDVDAFKTNVDTQMDAAVGKARAAADGINGWLGGLQNKTVYVDVVQRTYYQQTSPGSPGLTYYASGGISGAAAGGPRSSLTWVGEQGPELVRLAPGSQVFPAGTSKTMASQMRDSSGPMFTAPLIGSLSISVNGGGQDVAQTVRDQIDDALEQLVDRIEAGVGSR